MDRVDEIVRYLFNTQADFFEAENYFNLFNNPLTNNELEELRARIFRCDSCGCWVETCECYKTWLGEEICDSCYYDLYGED